MDPYRVNAKPVEIEEPDRLLQRLDALLMSFALWLFAFVLSYGAGWVLNQ